MTEISYIFTDISDILGYLIFRYLRCTASQMLLWLGEVGIVVRMTETPCDCYYQRAALKRGALRAPPVIDCGEGAQGPASAPRGRGHCLGRATSHFPELRCAGKCDETLRFLLGGPGRARALPGRARASPAARARTLSSRS